MNADEWKPLRGPFLRWPRTADAILAIVSFAFSILIWGADRSDDTATLPPSAFLLFVVGNGCLFWRRQFPDEVHAIVLVSSALSMLLGHTLGPVFAIAISLYNIGRYSESDRNSTVGIAAAYGLILIGEMVFGGMSSDDFPELFLPFVFWYAGRRLRARSMYLKVLQERAAFLEKERVAETEKAVARERTRIARELHDIVAHQVSLMTVQAGAAKTIVDSQPDAAAKAMGTVETAGRQALDELRHLLGVLRPEPGQNTLSPQPGRADLPRLLAELKTAGLDVALHDADEARQLPLGLDLAIYRIVQESLTNVLKHAGPDASATVRIEADENAALVEVRDNGSGSTRLPGSGHGITGMRERAQSLGGTLTAGPEAGGGYAVTARLPIREEFE